MTMGIQLVGHLEFWKLVLRSFDIVMTESLKNVLKKKDSKLNKNNKRAEMPDNKLKRSEKLRESIKVELKLQGEAEREGKTYKSGSALENKSAKSIVLQNLKRERALQQNMAKEDKTCKYYPFFCDKIGHSSAANKRCDMKDKSPDEKKLASDEMEDLLIEKYLMEKRESK